MPIQKGIVSQTDLFADSRYSNELFKYEAKMAFLEMSA